MDVQVRFDTHGGMKPLAIIWSDGREFEIDRVLSVDNASSEAGGAGRRYTVKIQGKTRYLYYANDYGNEVRLCWFVECGKYYKKAGEDWWVRSNAKL